MIFLGCAGTSPFFFFTSTMPWCMCTVRGGPGGGGSARVSKAMSAQEKWGQPRVAPRRTAGCSSVAAATCGSCMADGRLPVLSVRRHRSLLQGRSHAAHVRRASCENRYRPALSSMCMPFHSCLPGPHAAVARPSSASRLTRRRRCARAEGVLRAPRASPECTPPCRPASRRSLLGMPRPSLGRAP
jgi:hypothetical protein